MNKNIFEDLADQTARNLGRMDPGFAEKMARRFRRKFAVKISPDNILEQAAHFKDIYDFASSKLSECAQPSSDGFIHFSNIDQEKYLTYLREHFPNDDQDILKTISGWAFFYYLH